MQYPSIIPVYLTLFTVLGYFYAAGYPQGLFGPGGLFGGGNRNRGGPPNRVHGGPIIPPLNLNLGHLNPQNVFHSIGQGLAALDPNKGRGGKKSPPGRNKGKKTPPGQDKKKNNGRGAEELEACGEFDTPGRGRGKGKNKNKADCVEETGEPETAVEKVPEAEKVPGKDKKPGGGAGGLAGAAGAGLAGGLIGGAIAGKGNKESTTEVSSTTADATLGPDIVEIIPAVGPDGELVTPSTTKGIGDEEVVNPFKPTTTKPEKLVESTSASPEEQSSSPTPDSKVDEDVIPETDLTWYNLIDKRSGAVDIPFGGEARSFNLGLSKPNLPYQVCLSPRGERGRCRFLKYCVLPTFVADYSVFLSYACFIEGTYVGVCCPDSIYPSQSGTTTTPAPKAVTVTTTPKPREPLPNCLTSEHQRAGCGTLDYFKTRIVGGREADPFEYPWMASLMRDGNDKFCGGSLITTQHVLTAAHCVYGFEPSEIQIRLGEYDFSRRDDASPRDFNVSKLIPHPDYHTRTFHNDIAVVKLSEPTDFNCAIWPICLPPPSGNLYVNETAIVTGWGTIGYGERESDKLLEVPIRVWDQTECTDSYPQRIIPKQLCAGEKGGGKDSCQGDSGGPLVIEHGVRWVQVGVVSYGIRCAEPGFPGIYTRVTEYIDWLDKMTSE